MNNATTAKIMIIDDNPQNLKLLGTMLESQGYEVFAFNSGEAGYRAAQKNRPEIILLDINMPEKNGYEICSDFKKNKTLEKIPVIFLSALNSIEDKVEAFKNGGVDYITKPFQFEEVEMRVKTHLKIIEMQRLLENEKEHLEIIVAERTKELNEAYKKIRTFDKMKSDLLNKVSKETTFPWKGIFGIIESMFHSDRPSRESKEVDELYIKKNKIDKVLNDAALLSKIEFYDEKPEMEEIILDEFINSIESIKEKVDLKLNRDFQFENIKIMCNSEMLKKGFDIIVEFAELYCGNIKIIMKSRFDVEYIYISFILNDYFITYDEIGEFITQNQNDNNEKAGSISNVLAHRIMKLFDGDVYLEVIDKNTAAITIKLRIEK